MNCSITNKTVAIAWLLLVPHVAKSDVELIAVASQPATATDLSGLKDVLGDGTPHNRLGSHGSAIAYTGKGNRYILVADRGPSNGAVDYKCRFHTMDISVELKPKPSLTVKLISTTLLQNERGEPFVGAITAIDEKDPAKSLRLDPEGARWSRDGSLFISDEYGPFLYEFNSQGKRLRSLKLPAKFVINKPAKTVEEEMPPRNKSGRQPNKGMEGLAISPDGTKLYGMMQNALIQDKAYDKNGKLAGINNRLLEVDVSSGKTREFVYQVDEPKVGVSEIIAVNDREFLVLERDGEGGEAARFKRLFKIDISEATDVSEVESLPAKKLPATIEPVSKKLFLDFLDPKFKLAGPNMPEKPEGLAFGPDLPDGRRLLIVTTDNDMRTDQATFFWAFAIR